MLKILNAVVCSLLMISVARAQDVTVTGAEKPVEVGSLIVLKAAPKTPLKDGSLIRYSWFKIDNNTLIYDMAMSTDSAELYSGTGNQVRNLNFVVLPVVQVGQSVQIPTKGTQVTVSVIDSGPPVPPVSPVPIVPVIPIAPSVPVPVVPSPSPQIPISPVKSNLPAGQFGFAQKFAQRILDDPTLSTSEKVNLAKGLSANFKSIIAKVTAPKSTYTNFNQILYDTSTVNDAVFSVVGVADKNPTIRTDFSNIILEAYNGGKGKLNNTQALVTAWGEAAQGFDWVASNLK